MNKSGFLPLILCSAFIVVVLVGCSSNGTEKQQISSYTSDIGVSETQATSPSDDENLTPAYTLDSLKIEGTDISDFVIVYPVSFTREQCFEDMSIAAEVLADEIEKITGSRLQAVPDTEQTVKFMRENDEQNERSRGGCRDLL